MDSNIGVQDSAAATGGNASVKKRAKRTTKKEL